MLSTKKVLDSRIEITQIMYPEHANPSGNVNGGYILKLVDEAAGIVAIRHSHRNCVTASVDRMDFLSPVYVGDLLFAKASINFVSKTSMEIGVRVEAECLRTGTHSHVGSAYLTFVALDNNGKPTEVPKLTLEDEQEQRRFKEAEKRREIRLKEVTEHPRRNEPC